MTPRAVITLLWPDGKITTGKTWGEVEDAVRAQQYSPYATRREFRHEMRHRARVWSGELPRAKAKTPRQFLESLAERGMFRIELDEHTWPDHNPLRT